METQMLTMQGKTCLITGGSGGIGKATALALANQGAEVIIVNRDPRRGEAALRELRQRSGNPNIHLHLADLSSQSEIRRLAAEILAQYPRLHVLVNLAGSMFKKRMHTADGLEMNLALNYLSGFLLTNLLLDRLVASAPARVVNVTSIAHWWGKINFNDLENLRCYNVFGAYGNAKLAIILFTRELARRLDGSGVIANCVHPGIVSTGIVEHLVPGSLVHRIADFLLLTPQEGADTVVFLASSPEANTYNGQYFFRKKTAMCSKASRDLLAASHLWDVSMAMTNHHTGKASGA